MSIRLANAIIATAIFLAVPAYADVWRSEGYGYVVEASSGAVRVYDVIADRCTLTDTVHGLDALGKVEPRGRDRFVLAGRSARISFRRIPALPAACEKPASGSADPLVNFDVLSRVFEENYPSFAARGVDWHALRAAYRPRVANLERGGDPWPIFTEMLSQLHDPHVHLVDGKRRFQVRRGDATPIGSVQEALIKYLDGPASPLVGGVRRLAYDRLAYGMTGEGIGYLSVMTMGGFAAGPVGWPGNTTAAADRAAALEALKSALGELSASRGLVLDLRYNPGGSEEIADLIAGCFADRRRLAYSRKARDGARYGPSFSTFAAPNDCPRFVKPIAVLVGERTTSAAEALVMRMRVLPQVVVIGQATQGAHSDVLDKTMPNGWKLGLSNEVYTLADGHVYEGVGIPPSVETPPTVKEDAEPVRFGRDIDIAVAILNKVAVN